MIAPLESRRPPLAFTIRWTWLIVVALTLSLCSVATVELVRPERRFRAAETTAAIQVRVARNAAPTVESLERRILGSRELDDVWDDLFADATESAERRAEETAAWRRRLRVELDAGPIGDLRTIRLTWSGRDDIELGAAVVDSLARRYADEVSADRWYGSVDRLRAHVRAVDSASQDLTNVSKNAKAALRASSIEEPIAAQPPATSSRGLATAVVRIGAVDRSPAEVRHLELVDRRARLAATMQPGHPELRAAEAALAASAEAFRAAPQVTLASNFEPVPDERMNAPLLISPDATVPASASPAVARPAARNKWKSMPTTEAPLVSKAVGNQAAEIEVATLKLEAATNKLRREMDDMLLPRDVEFPVVSLDRVGLNVAHLRPLWLAGALLLSIVAAAAVSVAPVGRIAATEVQPTVAIEALEPRSPLEGQTPTAETVHVATPTEDDTLSDAVFQSAAEVEARLAAPVLAVVSRRAAAASRPVEPVAPRVMRRAA